ncbi:MAG: alpha/beta fold hydrolase [Armatimonadetes bacterium]|nr:alpha/beta fold hydrolase [Armatimonadota bacterium]
MKTLLERHRPARIARWSRLASGGETTEIGRSPREEIYRRDTLRIYRYHRHESPRYGPPVLLIYSLINRPSVLDLKPGRSVIGHLLDRGLDVYLVDWGVPSGLDEFLGLDVYVNLLLRTAVRQVSRHSGYPRVHLLGYCMGGSLTAMYTALHPAKIQTLTLLGAPLDFRSDKLLYRWGTDPKLLDPQKLVDAWGTAPAWSFEGYTLLTLDQKPARLLDLYRNLDDPAFVESYVAMETWVHDNIPVAGAVYAEFMRNCFHENRLVQGGLEIGGRRVDLGSISCPTLILAGSSDHLVPPETTGAAGGLIPGSESIVFPSGHIGLSVSRRSHQELWPRVCDWFAGHGVTRE